MPKRRTPIHGEEPAGAPDEGKASADGEEEVVEERVIGVTGIMAFPIHADYHNRRKTKLSFVFGGRDPFRTPARFAPGVWTKNRQARFRR